MGAKIDSDVLIMQQNQAIIDRGTMNNPNLTYERNYTTNHESEIVAMIALNQRYVATSSSDRTVQVWDLERPNYSIVRLTDFDAEVICMKKILIDESHPLGHQLITVESLPNTENIGIHNLTSTSFKVPVIWSSEMKDYVTAIDIVNKKRLVVGYNSGWFGLLDTATLKSTYRFNTEIPINGLLVLPDRNKIVIANGLAFTVVSVTPNDQVFTVSKGGASSNIIGLRCLGRNSEVFCALLQGGVINFYRTTDGHCLNTVKSNNNIESTLVLNFFSQEPKVFLFGLSKTQPHFSYGNIDQNSMIPVAPQAAFNCTTRGEPKMQILDLVPGSHLTFATVANDVAKHPGLNIWKLRFQ